MPSSYHGNLRLPRFYPILDTESLEARRLDVSAAAKAMLDAGASIVQFRHKSQYTRAAFEQAREIAALAKRAEASFVVNDRADVALMLDAGLHVGQEDLPPKAARRVLGDARMLGFSTHNLDQFRSALLEPVDYLAFGPVFPTVSKQNPDPCVGLEQLRTIRALTGLPLVAIGGITRDRAPLVFEAGADSVAVIGDLFPPEAGLDEFVERVAEWIKIVG